MAEPTRFPQLDLLFGGYLNQDYELSGSNLDAVLHVFNQDLTSKDRSDLQLEVSKFREINSDSLDSAFLGSYGLDFNPEPWGYTVDGFLTLLAERICS